MTDERKRLSAAMKPKGAGAADPLYHHHDVSPEQAEEIAKANFACLVLERGYGFVPPTFAEREVGDTDG